MAGGTGLELLGRSDQAAVELRAAAISRSTGAPVELVEALSPGEIIELFKVVVQRDGSDLARLTLDELRQQNELARETSREARAIAYRHNRALLAAALIGAIGLNVNKVGSALSSLVGSSAITSHGDAIGPGDDGLQPGESIRSPNGAYELVLQADGNIVEHGTAGPWNLGTQSSANPVVQLRMQDDCNLVAYTASDARWSSKTQWHGRNCVLRIQDDGNLVIVSEGNRLVWSSWFGPTVA